MKYCRKFHRLCQLSNEKHLQAKLIIKFFWKQTENRHFPTFSPKYIVKKILQTFIQQLY